MNLWPEHLILSSSKSLERNDAVLYWNYYSLIELFLLDLPAKLGSNRTTDTKLICNKI